MSELKKELHQYYVVHNCTNNFSIGDEVFLKSNPEVSMVVIGVNLGKLICRWDDDNMREFSPQTLLHYRDASYMVLGGSYFVCFN